MSRKTPRTLLAVLLVTCLFQHVDTLAKTPDGDEIIIVRAEEGLPPNPPRTPDFSPFFAYHYEEQIILYSSASLGVIDVKLVSSAGDYYTCVFDTENGNILLPISGESGEYLLQLTTLSGIRYIGKFIL